MVLNPPLESPWIKKKFDLGVQEKFDFGAQSVNLISQCDGQMFMVFFENNGKLISKDDIGRLFSLDLSTIKTTVNLISSKRFNCGKNCNFSAATGVHIDNNGELFIYSSPKYLSVKGNSYKIVEFGKNKVSSDNKIKN